jgi:hypothetical protein
MLLTIASSNSRSKSIAASNFRADFRNSTKEPPAELRLAGHLALLLSLPPQRNSSTVSHDSQY